MSVTAARIAIQHEGIEITFCILVVAKGVKERYVVIMVWVYTPTAPNYPSLYERYQIISSYATERTAKAVYDVF